MSHRCLRLCSLIFIVSSSGWIISIALSSNFLYFFEHKYKHAIGNGYPPPLQIKWALLPAADKMPALWPILAAILPSSSINCWTSMSTLLANNSCETPIIATFFFQMCNQKLMKHGYISWKSSTYMNPEIHSSLCESSDHSAMLWNFMETITDFLGYLSV